MIKYWNGFYAAVVNMRRWQDMYFKSRSQTALIQARRLEKEVDGCIASREAKKQNKGVKQNELIGE